MNDKVLLPKDIPDNVLWEAMSASIEVQKRTGVPIESARAFYAKLVELVGEHLQ